MAGVDLVPRVGAQVNPRKTEKKATASEINRSQSFIDTHTQIQSLFHTIFHDLSGFIFAQDTYFIFPGRRAHQKGTSVVFETRWSTTSSFDVLFRSVQVNSHKSKMFTNQTFI